MLLNAEFPSLRYGGDVAIGCPPRNWPRRGRWCLKCLIRSVTHIEYIKDFLAHVPNYEREGS